MGSRGVTYASPLERTNMREYGHSSTIRTNNYLDIEVDIDGKVVAVWFRCQPLPFKQVSAENARAEDMEQMYRDYNCQLLAVTVEP